MSQDCAEACSGGVGIEPKSLAEVREGSDGTGHEQRLETVEGGLAGWTPMEDSILPGQCVQRTRNSCEVLYISPVVTGETKEGADFSGRLGKRNLPYGCEE